MNNHYLKVLICLLIIPLAIFAGTKGKVSGTIVDQKTGEPLPGANVIIESIQFGSMSNEAGQYYILNIPPGLYSITCNYMGYRKTTKINVKVSVDQTTPVHFELSSEAIEMNAVVVNADLEVKIQRDLTSSKRKVDSHAIESLPVETVSDLIGMQAGVTVDNGGGIHIRGGRTTEVKYYVDGVPVSDPFNNAPAVNVENSMIQELEVISGTFDAEYGQAMSGIVNIVTKEGSDKFSGSMVASLGDFVTSHNKTFYNIDDISPFSQKYFEGSLSGPLNLFGFKLSYFFSGRVTDNEGWLYGQRIFNTTDYSEFRDPDPENWIIQSTGDSVAVAMNPSSRGSYFGKFNWKIGSSNRFFYSINYNNGKSKGYSHSNRLNPDSRPTSRSNGLNHILKWTHSFSPSTFMELSGNYLTRNTSSYKYKVDLDKGPEDINQGYYTIGIKRFHPSNFFSTGGVSAGHSYRSSKTFGTTLALTSQINYIHQIKIGMEYRKHFLDLENYSIIANAGSQYLPYVPGTSAGSHDKYTGIEEPEELAFYIQDKIELNSMIMNVGLRYDYFNSHGNVPTNFLDPQNDIFPVPESEAYDKAEAKSQISPRIGLAYPITDRGSIHASYGHFFQIPEFTRLYENPEFEIGSGEFSSYIGNANLEAQRTAMYEIGLQQQLTDDIILDVTGFFRDVRNLLGTKLYETYISSDSYGRYYNVDYGSVKGITVSLQKHPMKSMISVSLDYTYQTAKGNASNPRMIFDLAKSKTEPSKRIAPLNWDQRHTFNAYVTLSKRNWGVSLIGNFRTGSPYTPMGDIELTNSEYRKSQYSVDMRSFYRLKVGKLRCSWFVQIENLLDNLRYEAKPHIDPYDLISHVPVINTLYDYRYSPSSEPMPRLIKTGIRIEL